MYSSVVFAELCSHHCFQVLYVTFSSPKRNTIPLAITPLVAIDWMFVSLEIDMLKPNPQSDGTWKWTFGKWLSHEGRTLMNGISALIKDPREIPHTFCHVRALKKQHFMNQKGSSHQTQNILAPWSWASHPPDCEQ